MKEKNINRSKWLHVRLTEKEYDAIQQEFSKTTCRKLSDYARKMILGKPVTVRTRDASLDDFMAEAIKLRAELNSIGNNFNQAVHKLHMADHIPQLKAWILSYETDKKNLMNKVDEIKNSIKKIAEKWLQ